MKNYIKYSLGIIVLSALYCCTNDDEKKDDIETQPVQVASVSINLASNFATERYKVVSINPEVSIENGNEVFTQYKWTTKVTDKKGVVKDSIIGDTKKIDFITAKADNYTLYLTVSLFEVVKQATTKVVVSETGKTYTAKALSLIDYLPSPSYTMDNYEFSTKAEVVDEIKNSLLNGDDIPLGTFGGSIVLSFDHTVINAYGKRDFAVLTSTSSSSKYSPVSVYVAYDANKNGIADESEWYEIAGSEYHKATTIKNYEVTYTKPDANKTAVTGKLPWQFDKEYLKWTDNKNASGTVTKTTRWRRYNYYPLWLPNSYTLKGTKLAIPVKDVSDGTGASFNVGTFEWGYGGINDPSIDISWAVDSTGKKVHLPGIDFVKVFVPTFVELGTSDLLIGSFKYVEDLNFISSK